MLRRVVLGCGIAAIAVALGLMAAPIRAQGVSGNAIAPQYSGFGWFSYEPLPEHPTIKDLRSAGVRVPQDAVAERRWEAAIIAAAGVAALSTGMLMGRRRQPGQ